MNLHKITILIQTISDPFWMVWGLLFFVIITPEHHHDSWRHHVITGWLSTLYIRCMSFEFAGRWLSLKSTPDLFSTVSLWLSNIIFNSLYELIAYMNSLNHVLMMSTFRNHLLYNWHCSNQSPFLRARLVRWIIDIRCNRISFVNYINDEWKCGTGHGRDVIAQVKL